MKVYNDMPEAIVIFICCFDLFHKGRHIYTFKKFCVQDKSLMLGDEATTIFLNTRGTKDDISPKLKAFLEFIEGKVSDDEFVKRLEHRFFEAKQNRYWRQEYMLTKFDRNSYREEGRIEGFAEGKAEGILEGKTEGFAEGKTEGIVEGKAEGIVEGFAKAQTKTFDAMMNFMKISGLANFTPEQISQCREYVNNTLAGSELSHA